MPSRREAQVEAVVLGGAGGPVDPREHGRNSLVGRRRREQEADLGVVLLEGAIGGESMQVDIHAEVAARSLDDREHAGVQRLDRGEAVTLVLHHRSREALRELGPTETARPR